MLNDDHSTESESEESFPKQYPTNTSSSSNSNVGPSISLENRICKKTHAFLIGTMNSAFPDYDFSAVEPEAFIILPGIDPVIHNVNTTLFNAGVAGRNSNILAHFNTTLWNCINDAIDLSGCIVFTYSNTQCDFDILSDGGCM